MKAHIQNILRVAALSLTVALGGLSSAQAAIVKGSFDPEFGTPFANLGWEGTVEFSVPSACLTAGPIVWATDACNVDSVPSEKLKMLSANISLYDSSVGSEAVKATLSFLPNDLFPFTLKKIAVSGGKVTGIETDYSTAMNPVFKTSALQAENFAGINAYSFALVFDLDTSTEVGGVNGPKLLAMKNDPYNVAAYAAAQEVSYDANVAFGDLAEAEHVMTTTSSRYSQLISTAIANDGASDFPVNPKTYRFAEVPEPASIALMLGAIAALGATTRRRSKTTA